MNGVIHIGTFFNIPVKVHWTFGLLILFVGYVGITHGFDNRELFAFGLYIMVLFVCVVCHEYGHALMARRYGVRTRDIILSPIGGVARLESIPEDPWKELWIALAGPSVNIIIALLLSIFVMIFYQGGIFPSDPNDLSLLQHTSEFVRFVLMLNLALFFFNLIPAFPMDGGRVLRSVLAIPFGRLKATKVASWVGRILAIGFVGLGLYSGNIILSIIGAFVFVTAGAENKSIILADVLKKVSAGELMRKNFTRIHIGDRMTVPIDIYLRGGEKNFLVFDSLGYIVGSIPEFFIKQTLKEGDTHMMVRNRMSIQIGSVSPNTSLYEVYTLMQSNGIAITSVKDEEEILGVLDRNMLSDYIDLHR